MTSYYNEHDPYAAQWLRNLMDAGLIAAGHVDERSIEDVTANDLRGYAQCHFFAGIGVWSYALRQAGWSDDRPIWTGSCPCQSFSAAGKRKGFADERHLWPAWFYLIEQCRPELLIGEQVEAAVRHGWLGLVQDDLEGIGYTVGGAVLPACGVGAPHIRHRLMFVGMADHESNGRREQCTDAIWSNERSRSQELGQRFGGGGILVGDRSASPTNGFWRDADWLLCRDAKWRPVEPGTFPLAHGITARVPKLRALGNALVAPVAQAFIAAVMEFRK